MSLWNWLRRRKPEPLRFGTLSEVATEQGIRTEVREYTLPEQARKQPPSLVGPDVHARPLASEPLMSTTQRERMTTIDDLRAARYLRAAMLDIDETARAAWQAHEDYWGGDSGDENDYDGGGAV